MSGIQLTIKHDRPTTVGIATEGFDIGARTFRHLGHAIGQGVTGFKSGVILYFHRVCNQQNVVFRKLFAGRWHIHRFGFIGSHVFGVAPLTGVALAPPFFLSDFCQPFVVSKSGRI